MPETQASVRVQTSLIVLSAALFLLLAIRMIAPWAKTHDFLNFYGTAVLAQRGDIVQLYSNSPLSARPPFYAVALALLARLGFDRAYAVWIGLQVGCLIACCAWATAIFGRGVLVCMWLYLPAVLGIAHGQDCVFPLLLVIAAYVLAFYQKNFASGAVLGLGLFKFHLFVLWPLVLAVRKQWRMLTGFFVTTAAEILLSLYTGGIHGMLAYIQLLRSSNSEALHPAPEKVVSLWGALYSLGLTHRIWALGLVPIVAFVVATCRKAGVEQLFSTAISGSLTIVPHVYLYDATVLALPLWLAMFRCKDRAVRIIAILLLSPLLFLFLLLFGKPWTAVPALVLFSFSMLVAKSKHWVNGTTTVQSTNVRYS